MYLNMVLKTGLLFFVAGLLAWPTAVRAVNCTPDDIFLASQGAVDNFQANHGPCDQVVGMLNISGADITNLDGLSSITSVRWLNIVNNATLTDTDGLSSVITMSGTAVISLNPVLTNLNGFSGITHINGAIYIGDNPLLSDLSGLSGLESIKNGFLVEKNHSLVNLDAFSGLDSIGLGITIADNALLESIDGLAGVNDIDRRWEIARNPQLASLNGLQGTTALLALILEDNDSLINVDALARRTTVLNLEPEMRISGNDGLTNLTGLASLVSVDAGVEISNNSLLDDCSALVTLMDAVDDSVPGPGPGAAGIPDINGEVTLSNNLAGCNSIAAILGTGGPVDCTPADITLSSQSQVDDFASNHPSCDRVTGTLTVSGADIANLDGLKPLTGVNGLSIQSNPILTDTNGLSSVTTVTGSVRIDSNDSLASLRGLSRVTGLPGGQLLIRDNPILSDLSALSDLVIIAASLDIDNNDLLVDLDGFSSLTTVTTSISIIGNDLLSDIGGLSGLIGFDSGIHLQGNPQLLTLDGLQGISSMDSLVIRDNDSLVHVDELTSLTTIGSSSAFSIRDNANLTNLDGLVNLISVDTSLSIQDNSALDDCSALIILLDEVDHGLTGPGPGAAGIPDINGDVTLSDNLTGCNGVSEIVSGADLSLEVYPEFVDVFGGTTQTFDFILFNKGPEEAGNVVLRAEFDGTVLAQAVPPECGFAPESNTLLCVIPALGLSSRKLLQPQIQFLSAGDQTLTVTVNADQDDPNPDDNTTLVPIFVTGAGGANLAAGAAILDGPNELGHILSGVTELTLAASASNRGPNQATGVTVAVTMPGDWELNTYDPTCSLTTPPGSLMLTCPLANLAAPSLPAIPTSDVTQFTVVPNSDGDVSVLVSADELDPVPDNDTQVMPVDVRNFSADLKTRFIFATRGEDLYLLNDSKFEIKFAAESAGSPEQISPTVVLELEPAEHINSATVDVSFSSCTDQSTGSVIRWRCTQSNPSLNSFQGAAMDFKVDQPGDYTATIRVDDDNAFDPDTANNQREYTLAVLPPPPIRVRAIEVNQVVQDWTNSVDLIAGKSTVVRVFLENDSEFRTRVRGRLVGLRGGIPVAGSPLLPVSGGINPDADATVNRASMSGSINFLLPDNWTEAGNLELLFDLQASGRPAECAEPDRPPPETPDCRVTVNFLDLGIPELDVVPIQYTTDEVQRLIFDCGGSCIQEGKPPVIVPGGDFTLSLGNEPKKTGKISVKTLMSVGVSQRSTLLESALLGLLDLDDGQVVARRLRSNTIGAGQVGFRISIRNQMDYPPLTVDSNLTGALASVTQGLQGGVFQAAPTPQQLTEQVSRLKTTLPLSGIETRFVYRMDFDFKPTTYRDINPQLWTYWQLQDSFCPLCKTDALRVGGYPHQTGAEGSGGNAMNRVYSSYTANLNGSTSFGYSYMTGPHEFSHSFRKEHAVVQLDDDGKGTVGLCDAVADKSALLHPYIQEIPGRTNERLELTSDYTAETFPTIGPLDQGDDEEIWGMDIRFITSGGVSPVVSPYESVDYMSYCNLDRKWPSSYSYLQVANGLATGAVGTPDDEGEVGDIVYVSGTIDDSDTVEIAVLTGATAHMPDQEEGPLRVAFVDAAGNELSAVHVALHLGDGRQDQTGDGSPEPPIPAGFAAAVPLPGSGVAALVIGDTADPMIRIEASANAPTVEILSPTLDTVIADNALAIEWSAFDADGDKLRSTVFYSSDGGKNWNTLGINLRGESLTVPADQLAMSGGALVRVSVSDGIRFAEDVSEPFAVGNSEPVVMIISPPFLESAQVKMLMHRLEAVVWDTEDGNLPLETARWISDVDGPLGTGSPLDLNLSDLTPGCHTVSVSFVDSSGAMSTDSQDMCVNKYIFSSGFE